MLKTEIIKKSPLRILEKSTHGGLGQGNLGVIVARQGIGKTACLVHIATDKLFQDKHVIHLSFATSPSHIIAWYEDIFSELALRLNLENAMDVHDELIRNRVIMNFNQEGVKIAMVVSSLRSMIKDGGFKADCIIVDGFDFSRASLNDLETLKHFAEELGLEIWFSASLKDTVELDENGIPLLLKPFVKHFAIIILLQSEKGYVRLELKKDHDHMRLKDLHLRLDPKILLITEE